jgi:hypothetical protein
MLHHPIYAGAYTFGRRQTDPRRKQPGRPSTGKIVMPREKWLVLIQDFFPRYISWEQYLANQQRIAANQNRAVQSGAIRKGSALLAGLVVCGRCHCRMKVRYSGTGNHLSYICTRPYSDYGQKHCQSLSGNALNEFVSQQVLRALQPAALELSLRAAQAIEQERKQLERLFEQRLERARYEAERAARQYRLAEPEHRLVTRQLEQDWEQKLQAERVLQEEHNRFRAQQPRMLQEKEREEIRKLSHSIPALWHASTTTDVERKTIVRQVIEKVVVHIVGHSEQVRIQIHWAGGHQSEHTMMRPVACWEQMSQYDKLKRWLQQLIKKGLTSTEIAEHLDRAGWRPPKGRAPVTAETVRRLLVRMGLCSVHRARAYCQPELRKNEWWVPDLAKRLRMPTVTLQSWIARGWVRARQLDGKQGRWIVWADAKELKELEQRRTCPPGGWSRKPWAKEKEAK